MGDCFAMDFSEEELRGLSSLALAHVGDAVYELLVRGYLVRSGRATARDLHRETVRLVRAGAQASGLEKLRPLLTEAELAVCRRARNAHSHLPPKSASPGEYHAATALEALFGALYLQGQRERLDFLFTTLMEGGGQDAP